MASWLIPALKAVLPHVGDIVSYAMPAFTRKKVDAPAPADVVQQQIAELQAAAAANAEQIRALAAQLKDVVSALDEVGTSAAAERARIRRVSYAACGVGVVSLGVAVAALLL